MAGKIKYLLKLGWFQNRIAAVFDVNPGRVSEVKSGKRHPDVGPIPV
jgi:hypothetical protein